MRSTEQVRKHRLRSLLIVGDAMALELERVSKGERPTNRALPNTRQMVADAIREEERQ